MKPEHRRRPRAPGYGWLLAFLVTSNLLASASPASSALPDAFPVDRLLWERSLGTHQYTVPKLDRGRLYIGINDLNLEHPAVKSTGGGVLLSLDPDSGETIWQLPIPRYREGTRAPFHFNHWKCGVCSQPATEGDRLYIVGPRGDFLCLDRQGQANGNDGPFLEELSYFGLDSASAYQLTSTDGDILWHFDLIKQLGVVPHDVCGSSPLLHGDFIYTSTANGVDDKHRLVANPAAPSLIVLDKLTGQLVATDGGLFGERLLHGNWSSPALATVNGQPRILFGGGDGILYAFEPVERTPPGGKPQTLKRLWQYDCNPPDYRERDGQPIPYSRWNKKSPDGPSETIASPIVRDGLVYVSIGQSPVHGPGQGQLSCVDVTTGQPVWTSRKVDRALANVDFAGDLLFAADLSGMLHCLNAKTGELLWQHDLEGPVWTSSPMVVKDCVYVSTDKNRLWILKASPNKEVVARSRTRSPGMTPLFANDILYYPTQKRLFAVKL